MPDVSHDDDDELVELWVDLSEKPGEVAEFDSVQEAMLALRELCDEDGNWQIDPNGKVEIHQGGCDGCDGECGVEYLTVAELMPKARA